jgi:hypothetical protein
LEGKKIPLLVFLPPLSILTELSFWTSQFQHNLFGLVLWTRKNATLKRLCELNNKELGNEQELMILLFEQNMI